MLTLSCCFGSGCAHVFEHGSDGMIYTANCARLWSHDTPANPWLHAALSEVCSRLRMTQPRLHVHCTRRHGHTDCAI